MMLRRVGFINRNQRGFTLVELLVAVAIVSVIGASTTVAIGQIFNLNSRSTAHMMAIMDVENAVQWISRDAQMAQNAEAGINSDSLFNLNWVEWDGATHEVTYALEGSILRRRHYLDSVLTENTTVAQHIDSNPLNTRCEVSGSGKFTLPDVTDAFTITGGSVADSGTISVTTGSISVTATGNATYGSGDWTTPASADNVTISASGSGTAGTWTSAIANAVAVVSEDSDGDASITGDVIIITVTAVVGDGGQSANETRTCRISSRSSL